MRLALLPLICLSALAGVPTNSVTITEMDSTTQTNRPFSISRVFAQGEIPDYPQPVVGGTPETTWQSDVKTRWRDGKATVNITDATNEEPIMVTASAHGFVSGELVTIADVGGNTAANGTWKIVRYSRDKFRLAGSSGNGAYTTGGTATGPTLGSVQHAMVSFTETLTSGQSKTVTFRNSENPCSSGNQAACDAAGLDEAGLLAFNSASWGASIEVESPDGDDTARSASARTIVDDANFEYWLRGPVVTQIIAEDRTSSRTYDFGWTCSSNCTGDYSTATWADDTTYKSLHPRFILTFYAGWAGVKVDYILENTWISKHQDQRIKLTLKSDSTLSTTEMAQTTATIYSFQRGRKTYWDGTEPGDVETDLNVDYMVYSRALPMYDISKSVNSTDLASEISNLQGDSYGLFSDNGPYLKVFATGGGRPEIGMFPRWFVRLLLSGFDYELWDEIIKVGDVSGHIPIHYRESQSGTRYLWDTDNDGTTVDDADDNITGNGAFGEPLSIDGNPSNSSYNKITNDPGTTNSSSHGWEADGAHQSSFTYIPYLITGDPYYLEEMQFWCSWNLYAPNHATENAYARHKSWGIFNPSWQERAEAWMLRNLGHAVFMTPDSSLVKEYLRTKMDNTIAAHEAVVIQRNGPLFQKITNAPDSDPCPTSGGTNGGKSYDSYLGTSSDWTRKTPYCHGQGEFIDDRGENRLGFPSTAVINEDDDFEQAAAPWQDGYLMMVLGHLHELGFPTEGWLRASAKLLLNMGGNTEDLNIYCVATYRRPCRYTAGVFYSDWAEFYDAYPTAYKELSAFQYTGDTEHGYPFIYLAALSYLDEYADSQWRGWEIYDWFADEENVANIRTYVTNGVYDYKWAIIPRQEPTRVHGVAAGDTFLILKYTAPTTTACTVVVDDSSDYGSPIVNTSDSLTTFEREFVATGLTASTPYYWRITCADDPYNSGNTDGGPITTLTTLSGTASLTVWVGSGQSTTYMDYDQDGSAPWANTDSAACSSGCTLEGTGLAKGLWYYQIRQADGVTGNIHKIIVQ